MKMFSAESAACICAEDSFCQRPGVPSCVGNDNVSFLELVGCASPLDFSVKTVEQVE